MNNRDYGHQFQEVGTTFSADDVIPRVYKDLIDDRLECRMGRKCNSVGDCINSTQLPRMNKLQGLIAFVDAVSGLSTEEYEHFRLKCKGSCQ